MLNAVPRTNPHHGQANVWHRTFTYLLITIGSEQRGGDGRT
jgi:hypothetical protein